MNKNQKKSLIILIILIIIVLIVVGITKFSTNESLLTTQNQLDNNNNNNESHSDNDTNKDIVDKKYNDKIILCSIGTDYFFYNFLLENNKETIENQINNNKYKNIWDETNNNIKEIQEIKTTNNQPPITIKKAKLNYQNDNKQIKEIKILDQNSRLKCTYMFFYDQEGKIKTISVVDTDNKEIEKYEITNNTNGLVEEIKKTPQKRGHQQTTSKLDYNEERKLTKVSTFNFENQLINESVLNYSNNKLNQIEFVNNILNNSSNTTIFKILEQTN